MGQLELFADYKIPTATPLRAIQHDAFSHDNVCAQEARLELEARYQPFMEETTEFSRQLVSFQANKTETLHSWIKYREGFSATLVELLLRKFGLGPGDAVLDPFAGSCTTMLVAQALGIDAVGIELLPNNHLAWEAKSRAQQYDLQELECIARLLRDSAPPPAAQPFPHLTITESAFPEQTESDLMAYSRWIDELDVSEDTRLLYRFALMSILEEVSYTRKDGQYLRWDGRAAKIRANNERRRQKGLPALRGIDKGELPSVKAALLRSWTKICNDVAELKKAPYAPGAQRLIQGSALLTLPKMEGQQFAAVITSPPYANRYDYTRTYALELAYLGVAEDIFALRQQLLSCTVENRPKLAELQEYYRSIGQHDRYAKVLALVKANRALSEVNAALTIRNQRKEINNAGVLGMIDQYFTELAFVYAELFRLCRRGAHVAFVNDNVRYAGEVIPVDFMSTDLAEAVGFEPVRIYVLPQRKGNSSQQMGRFGRVELRKSITIWRKP